MDHINSDVKNMDVLTIDKTGQKNNTSNEVVTKSEMIAYVEATVQPILTRIGQIKNSTSTNTQDIREIKEEYPLLPPEADDLSTKVRRKMAECMGGKKSPAYKNLKELRKKICRDIYYEIKRQYDLIDEKGRQKSYKKLKRKHLNGAMMVVDEYVLPIEYQNQIEAENELGDIDC